MLADPHWFSPPGRTWSGAGGQDNDLTAERAVRGPGVDGRELGHRYALGDADGELTPVDAGGELSQLRGVAADEQVDAAYAARPVGWGGHPHGGVDDDATVADEGRHGRELVGTDRGQVEQHVHRLGDRRTHVPSGVVNDLVRSLRPHLLAGA